MLPTASLFSEKLRKDALDAKLLRGYATPASTVRMRNNYVKLERGGAKQGWQTLAVPADGDSLQPAFTRAATTPQTTRPVSQQFNAGRASTASPAARSSSPGSGSFHTANPMDSERSSPATYTDQEDWERESRDELLSVEVYTAHSITIRNVLGDGSTRSLVWRERLGHWLASCLFLTPPTL